MSDWQFKGAPYARPHPPTLRQSAHLVIALASGQGKAGIKWIFRRILTGWQRPYAAFLKSPSSRWEWQVQSQGMVLISGTGRTRLLARFLGNDARLRLLAEDFGNL